MTLTNPRDLSAGKPSCNSVASKVQLRYCRIGLAIVKVRQKNPSHCACDQLRQTRNNQLMPLPQTEIPGRLQSHLAERGIRMTEQRRAILRVMETATKHLDAAQLLRKAQKLDASVDRSTVYRTLKLLKRQGLIDELDLMHIHGEGHYYERKLNRDHIHMACLRCGKIMEFVSDIFEKLKGQVEKDCRFRIVVSRLEIGGYCAACSK
jgi:Fur family transcriptional regulator, ferric uptake regulator